MKSESKTKFTTSKIIFLEHTSVDIKFLSNLHHTNNVYQSG